MHDERPGASERPKTREHNASCAHEHEHQREHDHDHEHEHEHDHPAIRRLHAEFEAARDGMAAITRLTLPIRQRVVDEIRTGLPDIAGWAAHEAGPDATVAEIRRFSYLGAEHSDEACPVVLLWGDILETATVAASAAR
jgi:hypothetical protein